MSEPTASSSDDLLSEVAVDAPWFRVAARGDLEEGRVVTARAGARTIAISCSNGVVGALDNHCPHQGGPLGEGSIEGGLLRCPWHGYDYDPITGRAPEGSTDHVEAFAVDIRGDDVYVCVEQPAAHVRTVSDVLVDTMLAWGVDTVFGMVGHSNLGFADAMRRAEQRGELRYVAVRHEGAAAFAASAYGKLTGRPAACFAIAGPGSTNMLTGLYDAKVDRAPVLAISGQVPSKVHGRGAFQDLDLDAAFADVSAYSMTLAAESDHAELMTLAVKHALVERGVAHLILPDEVQLRPSDAPASGPTGRVADSHVVPPFASFADALGHLHTARRPVIIVGHGARNDMADVIALAERLDAAVLTTFKAKGQISDLHPLGAGVLGRSGTPVASWMMNEADLIVAFGVSFSNHTGIASYKPIIQVDLDPMALGRFHPVTTAVLGDVGVTARLLLEQLPDDQPGAARRADQRRDLADRWKIWRHEKQSRAHDDLGDGIGSAMVFEALSRLTPRDAVIAVDVGNNAYSFGRYFECAEQSVLMSGYLGSIGFGFPAAMGAWMASRSASHGRAIVAVTGDGGFGQYMAEFSTAVHHRMNITHVLLNNSQLGKISKEQRALDMDVWQTDLTNPNFADFAVSCGGSGRRVVERSDLDDALKAAFDFDGPALVEIITDPELL